MKYNVKKEYFKWFISFKMDIKTGKDFKKIEK